MSWRWRRSWSFGPLRVTVTGRGVSISLGVGPLRVSRGSDGRWRRTVRVAPGVWSTKTIGRERR